MKTTESAATIIGWNLCPNNGGNRLFLAKSVGYREDVRRPDRLRNPDGKLIRGYAAGGGKHGSIERVFA